MKILKYLALILILSTFILPGVPVHSAGTYSMDITVTDNSSTDRVGVPVIVPFNSLGAIATGMLDSNGLYTRLFEGTTEIPYSVSNNSIQFLIASLLAGQTRIYKFQTGYTPPNTSLGIIPGYGGSFTVADNTTLELSTNGTINFSGYIPIGVSCNVVDKAGALRVLTDTTSNNVTFRLYGTTPQTENLTPNATGNLTNIASGTWADVDDPVGAPDDAATTVNTNAASQSDAFNLVSPSLIHSADNVTSVAVFFRHYTNQPGHNVTVAPLLWLNGNQTNGTPVTIDPWATSSETLARPGGGNWSVSDLADLQAGVTIASPAGYNGYVTQVYAQVTYTSALDVTLAATPALHSIIAGLDGANSYLTVDGVTASTALGGYSVINQSTNYTFNAPCYSSVNITVGGTLRAQFQPNTIIMGTNLPDRALADGVANNGTITWGTNDHLVLVVGGLKSLASYLPASAESIQPTVIPAPGALPGESTVEDPTMPWYSLFFAAATSLGWGTMSLYGVMGIFAAMGIGVGVGIATGSSLLAMIAVGLGLTVGAGQGAVGWWVVLSYVVFGVSFLAVSRSV